MTGMFHEPAYRFPGILQPFDVRDEAARLHHLRIATNAPASCFRRSGHPTGSKPVFLSPGTLDRKWIHDPEGVLECSPGSQTRGLLKYLRYSTLKGSQETDKFPLPYNLPIFIRKPRPNVHLLQTPLPHHLWHTGKARDLEYGDPSAVMGVHGWDSIGFGWCAT